MTNPQEALEENFSEYASDVMEQLYEEAAPGLDYGSIEEPNDGAPYHRLHYLDGDRQAEIIEETADEYGLPEELHFEFKKYFMLGGGPSANRKIVNKTRKREGLNPVNELLEAEGDSL